MMMIKAIIRILPLCSAPNRNCIMIIILLSFTALLTYLTTRCNTPYSSDTADSFRYNARSVQQDLAVGDYTKILEWTINLPNIAKKRQISKHCEFTDYTSNWVESDRPCIATVCPSPFNRTYKERVESLLESPQFKLSRRQREDILHLGDSVPEIEVIFVSAVSSNHYDEMQAMFNTTHRLIYPNMDDSFVFILFDMGLNYTQRKMTEQNCRCKVITFDFTLFPSHVRQLRCYSWKPIIIRAMMSRASKLVVWQDSSVRWSSEFKFVLERAKMYGMQTRVNDAKRPGTRLTANTIGEMFVYMQEMECNFESSYEINAAILVFRVDPFTTRVVVEPWSKCALEPNCMCPGNFTKLLTCTRNNRPRCHRFDQSAISLILAKLYHDNSYKLEIPDSVRYVRVTRDVTEPHYFQNLQRFHDNRVLVP